jgi:threonyl-tRNA synthetase
MEANAKARASESREVLLQSVRNTAARLLAQAVVERYPSAKLGECGLTDHGFYYDFDLGADEAGQRQSLRTQDLEALRGRMQALVSEDRPIEVARPAAAEALDLFAGQPYKQELVNEAAGTGAPEIPEAVEVYRQGEFVDLGPGPFLPSTGGIDPSAIELLSISSAYWRGEESNPAMQRVYGAAWLTKAELDKFLEEREAARKIDHRVLGKELDIFFFDDDVGPGLPLFTPRGTVLIEEIERLAKEVEGAAGYERVKTPHVTKDKLFLRSGHLPYYAKSMFPPMEIEGEMYYIKPMNCPFHHKIYAERPRSYRDLPLRLAEYGTCYRYEKSGELMGLMRVRAMQMNDAHIYCTVDQFEEEFLAVVRMYQEYFTLFGIEKYKMRFSTHAKSELGKKYVDNEALWVQTEDMVRRALINAVIPYEEVADEAAFYGPKIDVQIWSATGREFTLATNQVDFAVPERFNLTYTNAEGKDETPLCIHRAPLSTHERLIGFLIEHFAGSFPLWLAPEQVRVVPVATAHADYAERVLQALEDAGLRASGDLRSDTLNAKIRAAELMKVPYIVVVGQREAENATVSVRRRGQRKSDTRSLEEFVRQLQEAATARTLELV